MHFRNLLLFVYENSITEQCMSHAHAWVRNRDKPVHTTAFLESVEEGRLPGQGKNVPDKSGRTWDRSHVK